MSTQLDDFAIAINSNELLLAAYQSYSKILLQDATILSKDGLFLDLSAIPEILRDAFIKWTIYINKDRIEKGNKPVMNIQLAMKCPIWKIINIPIVKIQLTKESLSRTKSTISTINSKPTIKTINSI